MKRIELFARRASDVTDNRTGKTQTDPVRPPADRDDGYWEWVDRFDELTDTNLGRREEIHKELQHLATERRAKRKNWVTLLRLDQTAFPVDPTDEGDAWEQVATWVYRGFTRGGTIPVRSTTTKRLLEQMKAQRERLKEEMGTVRPRQEKLIEEGRGW